MPSREKPRGSWPRPRRLIRFVCALGLLFVLPVSAVSAKVIDVPGTPVYRGHADSTSCEGHVYIQWPEQENAQGWRLEREYLKGTSKTFTHDEVALYPPFFDEPSGSGKWVPPAGHHWFHHTYRSKSGAEGKPPDCTGTYESDLLPTLISATVHITVPDTPEEDETEKKEKEAKEAKEREKREEKERKEKETPPTKKGAAKCRGQVATIFVKPGPPTNGTARRDVIIGTPGRDVIRARGGNDLVCGLGGNDIILGGGGKDVLMGQGGGDTIRGQGGADTVLGGAGGDHLFGDAAADRLFGGKGADDLNGGGGEPDLCDGGPGRDQKRSPGCERRRLIP